MKTERLALRVKDEANKIKFFSLAIICIVLLLIGSFCKIFAKQKNEIVVDEVNLSVEIRNLHSKDFEKKISSIRNLSKIVAKNNNEKKEFVIKKFSDMLKEEKDAYVKIQIIEALSETVNVSTTAYNSLISCLYDTNAEIRKKAILSTVKINNTENVIKEFEKILNTEEDKTVKLAVISVLRSFATNNEKAIILVGEKLLKDPDPEIRVAAVKTLKIFSNNNLSKKYLKELSKTEKDRIVLEEIKR